MPNYLISPSTDELLIRGPRHECLAKLTRGLATFTTPEPAEIIDCSFEQFKVEAASRGFTVKDYHRPLQL